MDYRGSLQVCMPGCQAVPIPDQDGMELMALSAARQRGRPRSGKNLSELVAGSFGAKRKLGRSALPHFAPVPGRSPEQDLSEGGHPSGDDAIELGLRFTVPVEQDSYALVYRRKVKAAKGLFDNHVKATMSSEGELAESRTIIPEADELYKKYLNPRELGFESNHAGLTKSAARRERCRDTCVPQHCASCDGSGHLKRSAPENSLGDGVSSAEEPESRRQRLCDGVPGNQSARIFSGCHAATPPAQREDLTSAGSRRGSTCDDDSKDGVSSSSTIPGSKGQMMNDNQFEVNLTATDLTVASTPPSRVSCKKSRRVFGLKRQDGNSADLRTPRKPIVKKNKGDLLLGQSPPSARPRAKKGTKRDSAGDLRMSPRTKKLTDAMQSYQIQRAQRPPWIEVDLGAVRPKDCIGRSCKVYWPIDKKWYAGVIHEYQSTTKMYRIDYEDEEKEWLCLAKERVKLRLSPEEIKVLKCPLGELLGPEHYVNDKDLAGLSTGNYEGLAALATGVEDFEQREYQPGDVLWAKVKGYPMWPAYLMDEERTTECGLETPAKEGMLPLQFFGSYDYARVHIKHVLPFLRGLMTRYHSKCTRHAFQLGIADVYRYLKSGGSMLPEKMARQQDEVINVAAHEEFEVDQDFLEGEPKQVVEKAADGLFSCPLELGDFTVLSFGKIVEDSEHFHDEQFIWPEGYKAVRKFTSMKDAGVAVEYLMEVLRNPSTGLTPVFRLSTEDGQVEGATASACWDVVFKKIKKARTKSGSSGSPPEEKRRKGPALFGFTNTRVSKVIQSLPHARVCNKFTCWFEKPAEDAEELLPAGYNPVTVEWKHQNRCSVCYVDEEYMDNLFLQCDRCRMLVHMNCYGEILAPDGDLWLCNLCGQDAPKKIPPCCICPVTGGAMKKTTDGRWAHIACAMWIPETCFADAQNMELIDGISRVNKERWKLTCSLCKVPYGACIQCSHTHCRTSYHPLCARAAEFRMEWQIMDEVYIVYKSYCKKHGSPASDHEVNQQQLCSHDLMEKNLLQNQSGCARSEPYNHAARRGRREPEALAAAMAKRLFVENMPYIISGCWRNPPSAEQLAQSTSLWLHKWKPQKTAKQSEGQDTVITGASSDGEAILSMSERYRKMRSSVQSRLSFGKSSIHGMGVFTKKAHRANEMVIEYCGELVRQSVADVRERRCYNSLVGAGTYMFCIDSERVVDATRAGSIAHLINHSCEPNCYSRVIFASGEDHIVIFTKEEIPAGVELCYDYRFASKDELLSCYCGKPNCRGSVNIVETNDEPASVVVPRTALVKWDPFSLQ